LAPGPEDAGTAPPPMKLLAMDDFVTRIRQLTAPARDPGAVQQFLGTHLIEPATMERYLRFEDGRYTRHLVFRDSAVELLVLCWPRGTHAPIHGHEGELCWARVERGRLRFTSYRELSRSPLSLAPVGHPLEGGPGYLDGPADIHAVETVGEDAVSLHVYVKPYDECDIYDLARGVVRRIRLGYDSVPEDRPRSACCGE
ncbi:MAG: cysteine dioxygenase family protein, partial [Candidatus Rokubacteria bacterium]|nr:cysteine dioxygenase family protein [Candidatus Rokubacteria bacterium]